MRLFTLRPLHLHYALSRRSPNSSTLIHVPLFNRSSPAPMGNHSPSSFSSLKYVSYFSVLASLPWGFLVIPFGKAQRSLRRQMASPGPTSNFLDGGRVMLLISTSTRFRNLTTFISYFNSTPNCSILHPSTLNSLAPPHSANLNMSSLRKTRRMACRDLQKDSRDVCDSGNVNWVISTRLQDHYFSTFST